MSNVRLRCTLRIVIAATLVSGTFTSGACVGRYSLAVRPDAGSGAVSWYAPADIGEGRVLERWRDSVGPPVFSAAQSTVGQTGSLMLVSWNTALGAGDVERLIRDVRHERPEAPIVLLLQEVYRGGPEVPALLPDNAAFASRLRGMRANGRRDEVETIAGALGMNVYYVPSMRNGGPLLSDEDRGNAILSTLPLSALTAFELPFERQRRVAIGATLTGADRHGENWQLQVVSAHLDNMAGLKRLWVASEFGRLRQTRSLVHQLRGNEPLVLGGDFNTWFGFSDQAFREAARAFPETRLTDRRATFRGLLRLDHLFFRLPNGWSARFRRADDNYGSDHYPLIATIDLP